MRGRRAYDRGVESGPSPSGPRRYSVRTSSEGRHKGWPLVGAGLGALALIITAALALGTPAPPWGSALPGSTAPPNGAPPPAPDPATPNPATPEPATPDPGTPGSQQLADRWARTERPQLRVIPPLRDRPGRAAVRAKAEITAERELRRAAQRAAAARRNAAVSQLLADRGRALVEREQAAFLATADTASRRARRTQTRLFRHLAEVPLSGYDYILRTPVTREAAADRSARRSAPGAGPASRLWKARASVRHRLAGLDGAWLTREALLRFVRRDGDWRLRAEASLPNQPVRRDLWQQGRVRAVQGQHSLVLGLGPRPQLRELAGAVDRAVSAVSDVWGRDWSRQVVVLAPESAAQAAALLGRHPDEVGRLAAVTVGRLRERAGSRPAGTADRVVLNPRAFGQLSAVGRRVVLRHEITHVATRAATGPATPMWLSEGFADYVGYQDTRVPVELAAQELLERVRVQGAPSQLPADLEFAAGESQAAAYEAGWLACRVLARLADERGLVDVYRAVGKGESDNGRALERALRTVAGTTTARFTARWRAELDALAR